MYGTHVPPKAGIRCGADAVRAGGQTGERAEAVGPADRQLASDGRKRARAAGGRTYRLIHSRRAGGPADRQLAAGGRKRARAAGGRRALKKLKKVRADTWALIPKHFL